MTKKIIAATALALATVATAAVVGLTGGQGSGDADRASSRETGTVKVVASSGDKKVEVIK